MEESSFLEYTAVWLNKVDRGGLLHVTDICFQIFSEIELSAYEELHKKVYKGQSTIEAVHTSVCNDPDVLRLWDIGSIDIPLPHRQSILQCIVHKWITLRGHTMTSKILEQYKSAKKSSSYKTKGVRNTLKRQKNKAK